MINNMRTQKEIKEAIKSEDFNWLGRDVFIQTTADYLLEKEDSKHICLNGVWGSGKTTTILGIINYIEKNTDKKNRPLIIYLDAWKYEHYEHPLFALIKAMEEQGSEIIEDLKNKAGTYNFSAQVSVNLPFFSIGVSEESKDDSRKKVLGYSEYIDTLNNMTIEIIKEYKAEKANKLIIFIDELDRGKPDFVLRTLEMFHHLRDDLPTHIVYSVDMNQLNSIIKNYYGFDYNTEIFTHKVFDYQIKLPELTEIDKRSYENNLLKKYRSNFTSQYFKDTINKHFPSKHINSLRTINKFYQKLDENLENINFFKLELHLKYNYYLGLDKKSFGGYLELLIIILAYSIDNPIIAYSWSKGENIGSLLEYIEPYYSNNSHLFDLIVASYQYDQDVKKDIDYKSLEESQKLIGLTRLLESSESLDRKCVLKEIDLF